MIYLDNSATTMPDPSVVSSFKKVTETYFANPSSLHAIGGDVEKLLHTARRQAAQLMGVATDEIIFTSGGTEGNNLAIKGIAFEHQHRGKHLITSATEHPSVEEAFLSLEKLGFDITILPVDENGLVQVSDIEQAIREDTILISIMQVNNEIGTIQPIKEIGQLAKKYPKLFFHVDAVQGLGKVPLKLTDSGIDLCTFSGHKIHGLKGTGMLYVKNTTQLFPLFHGGTQEYAIRAGTENVAGAVSFVKALRLSHENSAQVSHLEALKDFVQTELSTVDGIVINSPKFGAPHILNISVPGIKPEIIIHMLGEKGIYISTKSACSSKQKDESKVLSACGKPKEIAASGLRISFSYHNTLEEAQKLVEELIKAVTYLTKVLG